MYEVKIQYKKGEEHFENTYHVDLLSTVGYLLDDFRKSEVINITVEKKDGNY